MTKPAQLQKQLEAVNEHYTNLSKQGEADAASEKEAEGGAPTEDTGAQLAEVTSTGQGENTSTTSQENVDYEQKYRTLQGMFNAEVPRLNAERKELAGRVQQLEALLSQINQQQQSAQQPAQQEAERYITDEDVNEYGDSIDVMRRVHREESSELRRQIVALQEQLRGLQQVVPRVEHVAQQQTKSAEQQFWSRLTSIVPDWREVNDNPKFQEWLMEVDPMSGITRQAYLEDAQRNLDADRVSTFFTAWTGSAGNASQTQSRSTQTELEQQVAPGRSKNVGAPQQDQPKQYSTADIAKFYDDVRAGRYKNREDERARLERDIFSAQAEGRIVRA